MLLRKPPPSSSPPPPPLPPNLLRLLARLCTCPKLSFFLNPWIAKVVSTVFLLSPSPSAAAARLVGFRDAVLIPPVAAMAVRRLPDPSSAADLFFAAASPSSGDLSAFARTLAGYGLSAAALALLDRMISKSAAAVDGGLLGDLLVSFSKSGDLEAAAALLRRASDLNLRLSAVAFNGVMNLLAARDLAGDAVDLFRHHLAAETFSPDACSFNIAISCLLKIGQNEEAVELFDAMESFCCKPDSFSRNILVHGLCRSKQVDRAREILRGIPASRSAGEFLVSYTSVISGFCKMGKMDNACETFEEMLGRGIKPSGVTFNVLIDGFGKAGLTAAAASVYGEMITAGRSPDVVTFTSLIDGLCRAGELEAALQRWRDMREKKILPNSHTFAVLLNALCRMNRMSEARGVLDELRRRPDLAPPSFVFNPAIDGFCKAGNLQEANQILKEMKERGCAPDKVTYTILIIGHCVRGKIGDAMAMYARMIAEGCRPDDITVGSLVSCLLKAGMPGEARRIMLSTSSPEAEDLDVTCMDRSIQKNSTEEILGS